MVDAVACEHQVIGVHGKSLCELFGGELPGSDQGLDAMFLKNLVVLVGQGIDGRYGEPFPFRPLSQTGQRSCADIEDVDALLRG